MWHTTPEMLDFRYWQTYHMDFLAFEALVDLLTSFLQPTAARFVRPPIPVRKQVKLVLYRLAHGVSCARMHNLYGCGESTIRKYTMIVCKALGTAKHSLFFQFIHTPHSNRLQSIIESFRDITRLPNIASAIDGTHIPLTLQLSKRYTPMPQDFLIAKDFIVLSCKEFVTQIGCSGMFVRATQEVCMMLGNLLCLLLLHN